MNGNIIRLSVVDSTNIYTTKLMSHTDISEWTVIRADLQTAGKGQRGKKWESEKGKNLLCTIIVKPKKLRIERQFLISMATSLAIVDLLSFYGVDSQIKWPNDVLVRGKKICGLLIENHWSRGNIENSLLGIGLNINQLEFGEFSRPATSLISELGVESNIDSVLNKLNSIINERMQDIYSDEIEITREYSEKLFGVNQLVTFEQNEAIIEGRILGVDGNGAIKIETESGQKSYVNGQIKLRNTSA